MRASLAQLGAPSMCIRFVVADSTHGDLVQNESKRSGDIVLLRSRRQRDDECIRKTFAWFQHAIRRYPTAVWIGKADMDTFIQVRLLEADLRALIDLHAGKQAAHVVVGQFNFVSRWEPMKIMGNTSLGQAYPSSGAVVHAGRPCGLVRQLHDVFPRHLSGVNQARNVTSRRAKRCNGSAALSTAQTGPYPFAAGPLYLLSAPLARAVFAKATYHFMSDQGSACAAEDATIGYAIHAVFARDDSASYTLAHMPSAKFHNYDRNGQVSFNGGPPSVESTVVHFLKPANFPRRFRRRLHILWSWIAHATSRVPLQSRCWPLIRFEWRPAHAVLRGIDTPVWHAYHKYCSTPRSQYCRSPIYSSAHWRLDLRSPVWQCEVGAERANPPTCANGSESDILHPNSDKRMLDVRYGRGGRQARL